jgi:protein-serine/threonine kinase
MQEAHSPRFQRETTPIYDSMHQLSDQDRDYQNSPVQQRYAAPAPYDNRPPNAIPPYVQQQSVLNTGSESSVDMQQHRRQPSNAPYQGGLGGPEGQDPRQPGGRNGRVVLTKNNKRFTAYNDGGHRHDGSSNAARRVMDFFRRAGRARGGEDR